MLSKCKEWSDGGLWGYVVVGSAFMIQVINFGTTWSFGVYNVEFLDYFENSAAAISLVGSINATIILGSGPIASLLMNYLSHRKVALIGACISSIGLVCMPFSPNLQYMYFFYGVVTGLGFSLAYVSSHVLCGLYFQRHRSLATGIAISGQGVGSTVFPYMTYLLIETYGWKGSFFLMTGLSLHNIVFAALLRPPPKQIERDILERTCETDHLDAVDLHGTGTNKMHVTGGLVGTTFISKIKDQLRRVFNFRFIIYFINNIFWNMGTSTVLLFGPEFNVNVGLEQEDAAVLFTMIGCGTCLGCVLGGLLGNIACCNRIAVYAVANIATGSLTLAFLLTSLHTFWGLLILSFVWGLMFGGILGLLTIVTADLLGAETFEYGYGYLMLANGLGCCIAPPLAGWLLDVTGELLPGFMLAGLITIVGGLLVALIALQLAKQSKPGNRADN